MSWLNYHHLYYFKVIATEGGIAKASRKLRLGQPTLSVQLRQLEDAMGKPLFERRNRRLVLTETGRSALNYANEIFRLGNEMMEVVQDRPVGTEIHLQVGALDSVPKTVILALVLQAYRLQPCTVSILEGKGDELLRELVSHRIDLVLSNYSLLPMERTQVYSRSIAKMPVSVYGEKRFRGLRKAFPASLEGQPFVLPTIHSKLRHDLDHYFKLQGVRITPIAETQDTSLQKLLCLQGIGLAPLSKTAAKELVSERRLGAIGTLKGVHEEIWLISAERRIENPVAAKLMKTFSLGG